MSAAPPDKPPQSERPATGRILSLSGDGSTPPARSPQPKRRISGLWWSWILCVLLPFLAALYYYVVIATDRYAASAGFSIRGIDSSAGIDGIGALTGLASTGSTTSDSYIVLRYLTERQLLEALDQALDLRGLYAQPQIDPLSRLQDSAPIEAFLRYWQRRIHTQFDPTSGIIAFEVQAFSPDAAEAIAQAALGLTQAFVNALSAQAREDTLRFARQEVSLQERRLRAVLTRISAFRATVQSVDPAASAALETELIATLEARLIDLRARIAVLEQSLDDTAPTLLALRRDATALATQIRTRRQAIGADGRGPARTSAMTDQLARYEELEVERSLAQQAYASALTSLEQARRDADRQQRYLAVHQQPQPAELAQYPRRWRNLFVIAAALVATWGIGALVTYSVRDHLT